MTSTIVSSCQRRIVVEKGKFKSPSINSVVYSNPGRVWFDGSIPILPHRLFRTSPRLSSVSFESNSRLLRIGSEAFSESSLRSILIPRNVEILCSDCFSSCKSLFSVSFESDSRLTRIESRAFYCSSLHTILIPRTVEILCSQCFASCSRLESVLFESHSRLTRIESDAFLGSSLRWIVIPRRVRFIDGSASALDRSSDRNWQSWRF
jgi:hypothetical protein